MAGYHKKEDYYDLGPTKVGLEFTASPALHNGLVPMQGPGLSGNNQGGEAVRIVSENPTLFLNVSENVTGYEVDTDGQLTRYERSLDRSRDHSFHLLSKLEMIKIEKGIPAVLVSVSLLDYYARDRLVHPPLFERSELIPNLKLVFPVVDNPTTAVAFNDLQARLNAGPLVTAKRMVNGKQVIEEVQTAPLEFYVTSPTVLRTPPPGIV